MKHILLRAMQWLTNVLTIPSPSVSDGRCWAAHACHACHVFTPWPTRPCRETSGIYLKEGYTLFRTQYNLILQASVCVSEECTLRGEVADLLAPVIQTMALQQQQQLMPASLGPGHAQAVARAGTLKPPTYCWMMRRERKNDFFTILPVLLPCSDLRSVIRCVSCFLKIFLFRWTTTSVNNLSIQMETNILNWLVYWSTSVNNIIMTNKYCAENLSFFHDSRLHLCSLWK